MLWCPLRYLHKTMFGSSLPPVVCRRNHVLLTLCVHSGVQHILTIWVTWWFLVRGGDYLPIAGAWVHPRFLVGSMLLIFFVFCVVFLLLFVFILCLMCPVLTVSLDCPCLMCPVLTVSLDCPFFIAPSGFSAIYFQIIRNSKKVYSNSLFFWSLFRMITLDQDDVIRIGDTLSVYLSDF